MTAWVIALATLFLTGCSGVYFNTTFNAEKAYKQALALRADRLEQDPDDTVRVSAEEKAKLVRSITKSSKVLELWPRDPKYAPQAVFRIAECQLMLGEYASAAIKYDEFLRNFPKDDKVPLAKARLARALYEDGKRAPAREALATALEMKLTGEARREALLLQAQMRVDGGALGASGAETGAEGLALYEQLLNEGAFPTPEGRNEVRWRAAQLAYQLKLWDKARAHALEANEGHVPLRAQFRNHRLANLSLLASGRYAEALAESRALVGKGDFRAFRPDLKLLQARAAEGLGDWNAARALYRDAARGEPRSAVAGEAWYRLGLHAFDVDANMAGHEDSAHAWFDSSARAVGTAWGDSGTEAAGALARLAELRKPDTTHSATSDSARPHYREFMTAELFRFRLPRPDSARVHLERIVASPVEDTAYTKRAFYALAWTEAEAGKSARSDSLYRAILTRWPGTEWAQRAEIALNLPPTVQTPNDKAHALFLEAETRRLAGEDPARVAPAYRRVVQEYPAARDAAKSQFVLAKLVEEQARAKAAINGKAKPDSTLPDTVKAAYQEVRDKFPETPWAQAAEKWITGMDEMIAAGEYKEEAPTDSGDDEETLEGDESRRPRAEKIDKRGEEDLY